MRLFIFLGSLFFISSFAFGQTEQEIIEDMIYCSDCRFDRDKLHGLSAESIEMIYDILLQEKDVYAVKSAIFFLSHKYDQIAASLSPETKERFVRGTLKRIQEMPEFYMDFANTPSSLIRFNHPLVLEFAQEYQDSELPKLKRGAGKIIAAFASETGEGVKPRTASPESPKSVSELRADAGSDAEERELSRSGEITAGELPDTEIKRGTPFRPEKLNAQGVFQ